MKQRTGRSKGWVRPSEAVAKRRWRAADAREVLALWRRSGTTLTEFAREQGLERGRLARWRDRLLELEEPVVQFHRVKVLADRPTAVTTRSVDDGVDAAGIEVILCGGRRVIARPGFAPGLLIQVIEVLEGQLRC